PMGLEPPTTMANPHRRHRHHRRPPQPDQPPTQPDTPPRTSRGHPTPDPHLAPPRPPHRRPPPLARPDRHPLRRARPHTTHLRPTYTRGPGCCPALRRLPSRGRSVVMSVISAF